MDIEAALVALTDMGMVEVVTAIIVIDFWITMKPGKDIYTPVALYQPEGMVILKHIPLGW